MPNIRETIACSKAAEIRFLLTDLDAGFIYMERARLTRDNEARQRCLLLARKVYDTVSDFANRPALIGCNLTRIHELLAELKKALKLVGEEFAETEISRGRGVL
jgi:hypothetical protein